MSNYLYINTKSYQNNDNKTTMIIKYNDIVKVENRHYMIDSIKNNALTGTDMYGNTKDFFINDIQKIVFDSNSQTNINDFLYENEIELLENTLKDIIKKLNNPITSLNKISNLKILKRKTLEKLNYLQANKNEVSINNI